MNDIAKLVELEAEVLELKTLISKTERIMSQKIDEGESVSAHAHVLFKAYYDLYAAEDQLKAFTDKIDKPRPFWKRIFRK